MQELEQTELIALLKVKIELFEHKAATSITNTKIEFYKGKVQGLQLAITLISKYGA